PSDALVFVHVGRFEEQKNHIFLIDIFHEILKKDNKCILLLAGDGRLRQKTEERTNELGMCEEVKFLGLRTDIPEILAAADIFLMPSHYEGIGNVLVEAQAAGLPCFVSDSIPKEVDMGAGLVEFLPLKNDAETWSKQILASDKNRNPEAFRKVIEKGYSIQDTVRIVEEIYLGK
ncbi:MAG TPA: glycosyltransferase, partial [Clostridia bacterium]|nr:glycosyltransferase [Clostridia bacterium]